MGRRALGAWLALPAALAAAGCVQFGYERELADDVPEQADVEALAPGFSGMTEILRRFGAPLAVWEGASGAPVLAYGGLRARGWDVSVSVPLTDQYSASFTYADLVARTQGIVLILDDELRLVLVRRGLLGDLRAETERRRPAPPEDPRPGGEGAGA